MKNKLPLIVVTQKRKKDFKKYENKNTVLIRKEWLKK